MTIQVKESIDGRSLQTSDGRETRRRMFHAYEDTAGATITEDAVLNHPSIPKIGERHPAKSSMAAVDYDVQRWQGHANGFEVGVTYRPLPGDDLDVLGDEKNPDEIGFVNISVSQNAQFVDAWRNVLVLNSDDDPGRGDPEYDIGGIPIDSRGEPASVTIRMTTIDVENVVTNNQADAKIQIISNLTNVRNDSEFLSFPAGQLLFTGADSVRIERNKVRINYHFAADEFFHLRQIVERDIVDGRPSLGSSAFTGPPYVGQGWPVYHVQPYPNRQDFAVLGIQLR